MHITDKVLDVIFRFLKSFFSVLGQLTNINLCTEIGAAFPKTFYRAKSLYFGKSYCTFHKYPVCKCCGTVGLYDEYCVRNVPKVCEHIPKLGRGQVRHCCNSVLFKTVEIAGNRRMFYPLMTYCYIDLHTSLEHLLADSEFTKKCGSLEIPYCA